MVNQLFPAGNELAEIALWVKENTPPLIARRNGNMHYKAALLCFILAYLNIFVGKKRQKKSFLIPVKFTMCLAFSTTPSQLGFLTSSVGQWALPEVDMWLVTWSMPTARSHLVEFRGLISSSCCVMWTDWFTVHESLSSISVNLLVKCMMIALRVRL